MAEGIVTWGLTRASERYWDAVMWPLANQNEWADVGPCRAPGTTQACK
jgi:hypothetical protein